MENIQKVKLANNISIKLWKRIKKNGCYEWRLKYYEDIER